MCKLVAENCAITIPRHNNPFGFTPNLYSSEMQHLHAQWLEHI